MNTSLRDIFDSLVDLAVDEREARLADLALTDSERRQLRSWLAADAGSAAVIPESAERLLRRIEAQEDLVDHWVGQDVGSFALLERIGEGGTSIVFRAQRPVGSTTQVVALKLLYAGLATPGQRKRTLREQSILAQLQHPNIARLVEAGSTDEGIPYIATEFVQGQPITRWARERRLDLRQRLALMVQLCAPIEAAHAMLAVHCDLKPSNVFVDEQGTVKVLDFGVARLLTREDGSDETRTCAFTPEYAAPEQFRPGPTTVAVDVYALGVLLNELLTGQRTGAGLRAPSLQVMSSPMQVPDGLGPARALARALRGDLDAIVARATATDPAQRYRSAAAFAADLQRHLHGRPVEARGWSRRYATVKFLLRHRWLVAACAIFALAISTVAIVAMQLAALARTHAAVAERNATDAQAQARRAEGIRDAVIEVFSQANPAMPRDHDVTVLEAVEMGVEALRADRNSEPRSRIELLTEFANTLGKHGQIDRALNLLHSAHAEAIERFGASDEIALRSGGLRGYYLERSGRYAESLKLGEQLAAAGADAALETRTQIQRRIASAAWRTKDFDRARSAATAALALAVESGDAEVHRSTLSDYGIVMLEIGDLAQAVDALERVLALNEKKFGAEHEKVALVSAALSRAHRRLQHYDAAERHARRAIAISRAIYAGDHWTTANHMNALSRVQSVQRDYEAGLATDREILRIYEATLPADHPDLRSAHAVVGMSLGKLGRHAEALPYLDTALAMPVEAGEASRSATAHYRCQRGFAAGMAGEVGDGIDDVAQARSAFEQLDAPSLAQYAGCLENQVRLSLRERRLESATESVQSLESLVARMSATDAVAWMPRAAYYRARIAWQGGRYQDALQAVARYRALLVDDSSPDPELGTGALLIAASASQAMGAAEQARRSFADAEAALQRLRFPPAELIELHRGVTTQLNR